jgi:hypothetical protein
MEESLSTWRTFALYVAGNTDREALHGLLWDSLEEAQEYARENGFEHVYQLDMIASVANMTEAEARDDDDEKLLRNQFEVGTELFDESDPEARWVVTETGIKALTGGALDWDWEGLAANGGFGTLKQVMP